MMANPVLQSEGVGVVVLRCLLSVSGSINHICLRDVLSLGHSICSHGRELNIGLHL